MNPLSISWKSLRSKPLSVVLNLMLIAFGSSIMTMLLLASHQVSNKLESNAKSIDLVVGAKGSPLQLVLSSIYHIDFPTGNIPLTEARKLMNDPAVKRAVPLALGDNYQGIRIVGTDANFIALYDLALHRGKFWKRDFETTIGAAVARNQQLKVGDTFYGAHGLTGSFAIHQAHAYRVSGILASQGNVIDNLILTSISSVWRMHEAPEDDHDHQESGHQETQHHHTTEQPGEIENKELTSLLIQYRSPMSVATFPNMVNGTTNLQAASPAQESARLFSLLGLGLDVLHSFVVLIMLIATASVFISLYTSLKDRAYDLAIMRTLGASRSFLFLIVIFEGILLGLAGTVIGLFLGHLSLEVIGQFQELDQTRLTGLLLLKRELYLLIVGLFIGVLAGIIPALQAYKANISTVLSDH
jgi:putative ABC transport system permease protein